MASRRGRETKKASPLQNSKSRSVIPTSAIGTVILVVLAVFSLGGLAYLFGPPLWNDELDTVVPLPKLPTAKNKDSKPPSTSNRYMEKGNLTLAWDTIRSDLMMQLQPTSSTSNITPSDYSGPDRCKECHQANYDDWSRHPHRWMNALATESTVLGDFTGEATIEYKGGTGRFFREGNRFLMSYDRGELSRLFEITQTIGSRYYQYYIGKGLKGSEAVDHPYYREDQVLPFGFWLDRKAWVPIVHVHDEQAESIRWESAIDLKPADSGPEAGSSEVSRSRGLFATDDQLPLNYAKACNFCHTTFPLADMLIRFPETIGASLTEPAVFSMSNYLAHSRPDFWDGKASPETFPSDELKSKTSKFIASEAKDKAVTLGISCEACHLGCSFHADNKETKPSFLPQSPDLYAYTDQAKKDHGRTAKNINSACARCHVGARPTYAGGMATWNSTEHTDAMKGKCYTQLTCTQCHDPHKPTGKKWTQTPDQDDLSCLKCHDRFVQADVRLSHTRHASGSSGDRCMNCHMPHINEGMQDVVRTHTIFSPTNAEMIHENQPNACNLCHLEKPIDWTLDHLKTWYGRTYDTAKVEKAYPSRKESVGLGWLKSEHPATRLVAASAMARENAQWGLPALANMLDDEYLMNRQFTQTAVELLIDKKLNEEFGYWYYATKEERGGPIERFRAFLSKP